MAGRNAIRPAASDALQPARRHDSRERLLAAARDAFCARGYFSVSVDEIAAAAGVSRMTLYRHFSGKPAIAQMLFRRSSALGTPAILAIGERDYRDRAVVVAWLGEIFGRDRDHRRLLQVFIQANVDEAGFTEAAHAFIDGLIVGLGRHIDAFAIDRETASGHRRWIEAWLLLYEMLDLSNHAARDAGIAAEPVVIDILADRFLAFVGR
jgi:AcrR family transcriptional regulator